ncbi:MAG: response regulator, partial [Steroidobacteraceae bacterium]
PEVVRIVLSGQAEQESIVRATRTAHQYLSKPCDAPALKTAISRTQELKRTLSNEHLVAVVGSVDALPSPPKAYQELLACLRDPSAKTNAIVDIIRRDVGMTAKVVKLANSGFFGIRNPVQTVERAVGLVGLDAISTLVLGQQLFNSQSPVSVPGFSIERLGRHSFEVAAWARAIAQSEGFSNPLADAAFLAGVLHDVGRLVFATRQCPSDPSSRDTWLREIGSQMELHHAAVGGYLLGLWGFTDAIVEAIVWHHTPSRCGEGSLGLSGLVHIGDLLAHQGDPADGTETERLPETGYLEGLELQDHWPAWERLRVRSQPEEADA